MKDITFLELVDLDPTPMNRIVSIYYPLKREHLRCPHHIITRIANVARNNIDQTLQINQMTKHGNDVDSAGSYVKKNLNAKEDSEMQNLITSQKNLLKVLNELTEKIESIEGKIENIQTNKIKQGQKDT